MTLIRWRSSESSSERLSRAWAENRYISDSYHWVISLIESSVMMVCIHHGKLRKKVAVLTSNLTNHHNAWLYITQKSMLGGGWMALQLYSRVSSRSRLWDLRWSWVWNDLDMTWTKSGPELDNCSVYLYVHIFK